MASKKNGKKRKQKQQMMKKAGIEKKKTKTAVIHLDHQTYAHNDTLSQTNPVSNLPDSTKLAKLNYQMPGFDSLQPLDSWVHFIVHCASISPEDFEKFKEKKQNADTIVMMAIQIAELYRHTLEKLNLPAAEYLYEDGFPHTVTSEVIHSIIPNEEEASVWVKSIRGSANLYGVVAVQDVYNLVSSQIETSLDFRTIECLTFVLSLDDDANFFVMSRKALFAEKLLPHNVMSMLPLYAEAPYIVKMEYLSFSPGRMAELLRSAATNPLRKVPLSLLEQYSTFGFYEKTPPIEKLENQLNRFSFTNDDDTPQRILSRFMKGLMTGALEGSGSFNEIFSHLVVKDFNELQALMPLIMDAANNAPRWVFRGHSPLSNLL